MRALADYLFVFALTLWVGALWVVGYLVAPTLFAVIEDRALAGEVAGRLFASVDWMGLACGAYLLLHMAFRQGWEAFRNWVFWLIVLMLVAGLAILFGIQPLMAQLKAQAWPREVMDSAMREPFATWHGVSSVLYLLQSLAGLFLLRAPRRVLG